MFSEQGLEDLLKAKESGRHLLDKIRDAFIIIDGDARVAAWNLAAEKLFGYSADQALGRYLHELIIPEPFISHHKEGFARFKGTGMGPLIDKTQVVQARDKEGNEIPIELSLSAVQMVDTWYAVGTIRDISERVASEEALTSALERYTDFYNNAPDMFMSVDARTGKVTECNRKVTEALGISDDQIIGKYVFDLYHPDSREHAHEVFDRFLATGEITDEQMVVLKEDGSNINISLRATAIRDHEGNILSSQSVWTDVTGRKETELALEKSEEQFRSLAETSQDLVWKANAEGKFTYLNPAWEQTHGYRLDEMLGRPFTDFERPEIAERDIREFGRHIAGGSVRGYETTQIHKAGKEITMLFNAIPLFDDDGNIVGTQGTAQDITERRESEQALRRSVDLLNMSQAVAHMGHWQLEVETGHMTGSDELYKVFGLPRGPLALADFVQVVHPDHRDFVVRTVDHAIAAGSEYDIEHWLLLSDGTTKFIRAIGTPDVDKNGKTTMLTGIVQDITHHKRTEDELKESRRHLARAQTIAHLGSWDMDIVTGALLWSEETHRIFQVFPIAPVTLDRFFGCVHPDDLSLVKAAWKSALGGAKYDVDHRIIANGETKWVNETAEVEFDHQGMPLRAVGTVQDITERKASQEAVHNKDREIRKAYIDVFSAVTDEKLIILTALEIEKAVGKPCEGSYVISSFDQLAESRDFVRGLLGSCGLDEERIGSAIMASGEAVTNGVKHGGSCEIEVFMKDKIIQMRISDRGPGIDFSDLPKATLLAGFSTKKSLGMGFAVILDFFDRVFISTSSAGTVLLLESGLHGEVGALENQVARGLLKTS